MQPRQTETAYRPAHPRAVALLEALIQPPVFFAILLGSALVAQALA